MGENKKGFWKCWDLPLEQSAQRSVQSWRRLGAAWHGGRALEGVLGSLPTPKPLHDST